MQPMTRVALARQSVLWNRTIPACAKHILVGATHIRYLHPTKGWREVSLARVGL